MITLRGKLTRTLVEAKAATPATTRSNLAPSESAAIGQHADAASAVDSAPVDASAAQESASKTSAMVEEWLWRGVWAFGSLPEQDGASDAMVDAAASTSVSATDDKQNQTHREESKDSAATSQSWIQKLTSRITVVASSSPADGPSRESTNSIVGSAPIDKDTQPTANVTQDDPTAADLEAKPRPFSYRFIKPVDASQVVVPSSLVLTVDDENHDADSQQNLDRVDGAVDTEKATESTEKGDDTVKIEAQEVLDSSNANDKRHDSVQNKEQPSANQVDEIPKTDTSIQFSPSDASAVLAQPPSQDVKNDDKPAADTAAVSTAGDKSPPTTQNSEKPSQPATTAAAAAVLPTPTAQTHSTSIPYKQTYGDAPYTEAHLIHPLGTCPPGGKWEGHFENIVPNTVNPSKKRKDKKDNRVREIFYLFFNATPPADARTAFVAEDSTSAANDLLISPGDGETDESKQEDDAKLLLLPKGKIHVRGYGTNRFGTFEIVGSFDPKNGMLHCQRMYVQTPPPDRETSSSRKQKRSSTGQFSTGRGRSASGKKDGQDGKRGRKRKPSLKKRHMDSFGSFESGDGGANLDENGFDIASIVKKRARLSLESFTGDSPTAPALPQCRGDNAETMYQPFALVPTTSKLTPSTKGSGSKITKSKKKKITPSLKTSSISRIAPLVDIIEPLPSEGDPFLARWRAAHFLYYQRVEATPDGGEAVSAAANVTGGKVNSVVYEGEMMDGFREGMGICLYGNGTMYEGQWKRNKEHGKGTLMTPDRSKIIYQGDWERGRMHGTGSYYYHKDNVIILYLKRSPIYNDAFMFVSSSYTFPDGSVYEGEWRDNTPNGWGVFRWPDNSVFQGMWKDGRRHGNSGTLIVSDGFRYEGAWVDNAMEGRGVATYPDGQIYEGMWVAGRREGRGTIRFTNGAVYEGRFKDDNMEGQGTMKMSRNVIIPSHSDDEASVEDTKADKSQKEGTPKNDWMIPIEFQSDISHIHQRAGFTQVGL
eukprot:CCRYP_008164-RA/>CCRYP_008164-RA protein AED:0.21 eAED:0.21 QI:406/0.8/0.66/1/0.8/0.66/6/422/991